MAFYARILCMVVAEAAAKAAAMIFVTLIAVWFFGFLVAAPLYMVFTLACFYGGEADMSYCYGGIFSTIVYGVPLAVMLGLHVRNRARREVRRP